MKLYVLPLESACNARCPWCITKFRQTAPVEKMLLSHLERALAHQSYDSIEITGGGEATLHPSLDAIIEQCDWYAPTTLYTNGELLERVSVFTQLKKLCVSIAHYDTEKNHAIMGVTPDFTLLSKLRALDVPLKFSLLLHTSGIRDRAGVLTYLDWAKQWAGAVVVRQLFEHDYQGALPGEFVSTERIFNELGVTDYHTTKQGNPLFTYQGLEVECEFRSCACEMHNPVLHADGTLHRGWTAEVLHDFNRE